MFLNIDKYISKYSFVKFGTEKGDVYFCNCGNVFNRKSNSGDNDEIKQLVDIKNQLNENDEDVDVSSELQDIFKNVKISIGDDISCPKCKKNLQTINNKETLISDGEDFISGFVFIEKEDSLLLMYSVIKPNLESLESVQYTEEYSHLRFDKIERRLFFKDFKKEEVEFDLDEIISTVNKFMVFKTNKVIGLFDMHSFVNRLANFTIDSKNIDIVNDLLKTLHGKNNDPGQDVVKKIISIFFGIIKYSNLSTIAITKGSIFLYDIMLECDIPNSNVLRENNITSPIKIFNFLVKKYVSKLNEEINVDNKTLHNFKFKSKTRIEYDDQGENVEVKEVDKEITKTIQIKTNANYKEGKVQRNKGEYKVEEAVADGTISKFVFKQIKKFSDYKKIIKFLKHTDKNELIHLLQKYELEFLVSVIDLIYFREKTNIKDLKRLLNIILDFTAHESKKHCKFLDGVLRMDYNHVSKFDFIIYDDTLMMMAVLKFDPKIHFNKIKTFKELREYHDNLVKYFSVLKDEEKNGSIMDFVSKFKFIEDRANYDGPLEFKLLSTPGMIINEGIQMRHSAAAYATKVAQGFYLMAQVYDKSPERGEDEPPRYTIGFDYNKNTGLEFDQVKGFANELGEGMPKKRDRFKKELMKWMTIKDISYRPIGDIKLLGDDLTYESKL
jgi:hypothetical protein